MATIDFQKLADLLGQLSQKLVYLTTAISAWQTAQTTMDSALADANAIASQITAMDPAIVIPRFMGPVTIDPAWAASILDSAAKVQAQGNTLKSAIPK